MQNREVVEQLSLGYRMPRPQTCPGPVYAEVLKCWDDEPSRLEIIFRLSIYFQKKLKKIKIFFFITLYIIKI
jgi:hypothetical protein